MPADAPEHVTAQMADGEPLLVDVRRAAQMLGITERHTWRLIAAGTLPTRTIGRRRLVPYDALKAFVASLPN